MKKLSKKILNGNKKLLIVIAFILMLIFISVMYFTNESLNPKIHKGIKIEEVDVSNLSKEEALKKVKIATDEKIENKKINFF